MVQEQPIDYSYLKQRLDELGISDEQNKFVRKYITKFDEEVDGKLITKERENVEELPVFTADKDGNIIIHYFNLLGQPYRWKKEETKLVRDYTRKRWRTMKLDDDGKEMGKYAQEKGSPTFPFFPPAIIKKYQACKDTQLPDGGAIEPIETLYVIEGEIKSYKGSLDGLDIIGVPSIHGFYNGDVRGKLHEDIQDLIVTCSVEKVVFLVDADLLSLKWEEKKDLAKRPESFYQSVKLFRESLQLLLDDEDVALDLIYIMHIETKYMNEAKGLDDLLAKYPAIKDNIIKDLKKLQFANTYFVGKLLNDTNKDLAHFRRYLGLYDEQEFYKCYKEFIGSREFLFRSKRFEFSSERNEVVFVRHDDADKYMRIGADWFKVIKKIDKFGMEYEELKVWPSGEISRDYKRGKNADYFFEQLIRYDDFINEPSWNGIYQRSMKNCYNLCYPLRWDKVEGPVSSTLGFLKHIFGGEATAENNILGDPFTIALDWLTLFHKDPKLALPVIILVSKENETGKSTFMKWLRTVYGPNNAVILSNEEFKMKFNSHYISKALIMVDEGFLDAEKKSEKERLKKLVTSDTAYIEFKGADLKLINYYAKMIINSNDEDNVMKIDQQENRWFVIKVPVPKEKDPDLESKMQKEIPAWINFLQTREVAHPRKSRLWFDPALIITDQFRKIVEATKNRLDRVFEDWMKEQFRLYRLPKIKYSISFLTLILNDNNNNKYKVDKIELRKYLEKLGIESEKRSQRFRSPISLHFIEGATFADSVNMKEMEPTFPYIFNIEDWLSQDEVESLMPLTNPDTYKMAPLLSDGVAKVELKTEVVQTKLELTKSFENADGTKDDLPF